jgi:oxygen-independent coproporphyrinogen-3 oxidase
MESDWPQESLGIYVHIPFCLRKCAYCDFYSVSGAGPVELEAYTARLCLEIADCPVENRSEPVDSIYFGGGTPSLLTPAQLGRVIEALASSFNVQPHSEISMEANPATVDRDSLRAYRDIGINRISLGVQSLQDQELHVLERLHSVASAREATKAARLGGFKNLNLDLIYGIPGQTITSWMETVREAVSFEPEHISMYLLQLDEETPLARAIAAGNLQAPADEECEAMYYQALDYAQHMGLQQYEISNLAMPGRQCRHNLRYWQFGEYLGFGAGAVSRIKGRRWMNRPDLDLYMLDNKANMKRQLLLEEMSPRQQATEAVIMGLRLTEGLNLDIINQRFGLDLLSAYETEIEKNIIQGSLELEHGWLRLTKAGIMVSNQVLCGFVE